MSKPSMATAEAMAYISDASRYMAIAYYRLSKEDLREGESESIENQRDIVREYCRENDIMLVGEYIDDGKSGLNTNRDGFQEAIRVMESGKCNMFITKDLSRLSRDHIEADRFVEEVFPQHGVRYVAVDDNVDTLREYDIIVPFKNLFNEMSSRDTSKKVTHALQVKRERGEYCTRAPYGYKKDPNDNTHLVPDERCAWVVKRIFELYSDGYKPKEISNMFNAEGIPTPTEMHGWQNPHETRRDKHVKLKDAGIREGWDKSSLYVILNNQVYLGHTVLGKTRRKNFKKKISEMRPKLEWIVTPDTHEPLISQELFDRCQRIKKSRASRKGFTNIFSGFAFCDTCGGAMTITKSFSERGGKPVRGLRCGTNIRFGEKGCQSHRISYDDLIAVVTERLNHFLTMTQEEREDMAARLNEGIKNDPEVEEKKRAVEKLEGENQKDIQSIEATISKSIEGIISQDVLDSMLKVYNNNISVRNSQIKRLKSYLAGQTQKLDFSNFIEGLVNEPPVKELTSEVLEKFIDRIEISHYKLPEGKKLRRASYGACGQRIKIKYKFMPNIFA